MHAHLAAAAALRDLPVNIHPAHFRLAVSLHRAVVFPAVPFVKGGMVGQEIEGIDALRCHVVTDGF